MLHGYLDSWFSFSEVMKNMPPEYHVISLTQRGHGDSDKPEKGYLMTDFSEDVVAFMDRLQIDKASIVGHSMGTVIAQQVAIDYPERVYKLILIGAAATGVGNEILQLVADELVGLADPIERQFVFDFQSGTAPSPVSDQFIENIVSETSKVPARVWRNALAGLLQADLRNQLYSIRAQTLIMWGDEDEIFPEHDQRTLQENIPNVTFVVYPNLNHSIQWQRPRLAALEITTFLKSSPLRNTIQNR